MSAYKHRRYKSDLTSKGLQELASQLREYKTKVLAENVKAFLSALTDEGITVAKQNLPDNKLGQMVTFSKRFGNGRNGVKCILVATSTGIIQSQWIANGKKDIKSADVSPLLMVEFGSGFKASNPLNVPGVGQGTFPNQTHAFDKDGWWYMDLNGEWHHSYGVTASAPMYKADLEMMQQIEKVAKKVFRQ